MSTSSMNDFLRLSAPAFTQNRLNPTDVKDAPALGGLRRSIQIFHLPDKATESTVRNIAVVMMIHGRSASLDIDLWQTWGLSWILLGYRSFEETFASAGLVEYELKVYPREFVDRANQLAEIVMTDPETVLVTPALPQLPPDNPCLYADYCECGTIDGLYTYLALVIHLT